MCEHFKLIMVQLQFVVPFSVIVTLKTAISVLLLVTVRKHPTVLSAIKTFLWYDESLQKLLCDEVYLKLVSRTSTNLTIDIAHENKNVMLLNLKKKRKDFVWFITANMLSIGKKYDRWSFLFVSSILLYECVF